MRCAINIRFVAEYNQLVCDSADQVARVVPELLIIKKCMDFTDFQKTNLPGVKLPIDYL